VAGTKLNPKLTLPAQSEPKAHRHSQSMREVYAPNLSNGTVTATLQQLDYLITERALIKQQAADVF
jgi:hypothetical protein